MSSTVFACHQASCRPPTSGGTGGSSKSGVRSFHDGGLDIYINDKAILTVRNHTIELIWTKPSSRRQGAATQLLTEARKVDPAIQHSNTRTAAGRAWAKAQGAKSSTEGSDSRQAEWDGEDAFKYYSKV